MARRAQRNRVHSAVTWEVTVGEAYTLSARAGLVVVASGQLRFLGLK